MANLYMTKIFLSGKCKKIPKWDIISPTGMAIIKNIDNNKYWQGYRETETLINYWQE